jgi:hypothetical protein
MTGNQDRAAGPEGWAETMMRAIKPEIEDCVRSVTAGERLAPGDVAGAERKARCLGVMARSVRSVAAMATPSRREGPATADDDAGGETADRDDSPETRDRLRHELEHRLDQLHGRFDAKGVVVEPGRWPVARSDREPARAS